MANYVVCMTGKSEGLCKITLTKQNIYMENINKKTLTDTKWKTVRKKVWQSLGIYCRWQLQLSTPQLRSCGRGGKDNKIRNKDNHFTMLSSLPKSINKNNTCNNYCKTYLDVNTINFLILCLSLLLLQMSDMSRKNYHY